jgi:FkbM family methyltransferase
VGNIRGFLKRQALTRLPEPWLRALRRRHYERVVRSFKEEDEPDLKIVKHLVPPGTTAIDLGANIGVYTKVLSSLTGPSGHVVSVEPVAETFGYLTGNVQALRMTNVRLVNAAVSDQSESLTMELPDNEFGGPYFTRARIVDSQQTPRAPGRYLRVRSTTLDEIAVGEDLISFVKCDVEGHEFECLAGAESVIAIHHPAWLIEVWGDPDELGSLAADVFGSLALRGYSDWFFDGKLLRKRQPGDRSTNYFFLTTAHVTHLRLTVPLLLA